MPIASPRTAPYAEVLTPRLEEPNGQDSSVNVLTDDVTKKTTNDADADSTGDGEKKKSSTDESPVSLPALYRYATPLDQLCLTIGVLCAAASGVLFPCMALVFGKAIAAFQRADGGVDTAKVNSAALDYLSIAIALFVVDYFSHVLLATTAENQMKRLRGEALRHMLYMDITWYDSHDAMQLSTRLTGDTVKIKDGMGSKLGETVKYLCQFVAGYAIGFAKGWDTTLVMMCVMPMMAVSMGVLLTMVRKWSSQSQAMYAEGGAIAEETLSSIRTVASLTAETRAIEAYREKCEIVEQSNIQLVKVASLILGFFMASTWLMYAAGLWYGGYRVSHDQATPMDVFQGFFGVLLGTIAIAQISPGITAVSEARGAAAGLYKILATPSEIDASKDEGIVPASCAGRIQAVDLHFAYPSRLDAPILNGYSVTIEAGQTVAFVGASGGGKSTLISLLERYYNPQSGQLFLDGRDISTLNLKWLRAQIGVVSQEPVLFAQSILENILVGREGASRDEAIQAAKMASAHSFILALPQQYETLVGEKGVSMSGGQKQRIAIARAIVRNPKILVLDEATSALDAQSERAVQSALNDLMDKTKMTTIVIAHRLSTVRRADQIVVLSGGRVVEQGTHAVLMAIDGGVYNNLSTIQEGHAKKEQECTTGEIDVVASAGSMLRQRSSRSSRSSQSDVPVLTDQDAGESDDGDGKRKKFTVLDAIALSRPERSLFAVGSCAAALGGLAMPLSALLLSQLLTSMIQKYGQYETSRDRSHLASLSDDVATYGAFYVGGAFALWATRTTSSYCFRYMQQKLTTRVRMLQFAALCRQNMAFFDDKAHGTGALTADLSTFATNMAPLSGDTLGRVVESVFTFVAAMVISFALGSVVLSLLMLVIFPLLIANEAVRSKSVRQGSGLSAELSEVGAHASEALCNMRTVVSLGLEDRLRDRLDVLLEKPLRHGRREAQINGVALGVGSFVVFATYALVFWFGGTLVRRGDITFLEMMRTLMAVMMSAQGVGAAASFLADSEHALQSGAAVAALCDRQLLIDSFAEEGDRPSTVQGKIEFKNVTFRYPTRPGVAVLKNYSLTIEPGQTVAFCGLSGGGKSTCIAMLERFYDPVEGEVLLDGRNLKHLNLKWLRSQIGLVGQEPTLFIGTIAQNIAYGLDTQPSCAQIEAASKLADAHGFITRFPDGYDTQVGMKGEQLSGGQKQRIAIARAVLRNPAILLLDEATSALDAESEKLVQSALDKVVALQRRTTIVIAHRLSTIRQADKICVVSGGQIAEQGTHRELLTLGGVYKTLVESAAA